MPPLRCSVTMEHLFGLGACLVATGGAPPAAPAAVRSRPGEISSGALDVLRCCLLDSPSAGAGAPDSVAEFDSVVPMPPPSSCATPSPFGLCSSLSQKGTLFAVSLLPPAGVPPWRPAPLRSCNEVLLGIAAGGVEGGSTLVEAASVVLPWAEASPSGSGPPNPGGHPFGVETTALPTLRDDVRRMRFVISSLRSLPGEAMARDLVSPGPNGEATSKALVTSLSPSPDTFSRLGSLGLEHVHKCQRIGDRFLWMSIDEHAPHHRTPRDLDVIGHRYAVQPLPARRVAQHVHVAGAQGDAKGAALRRLVPWPREHE